MTPSSRKPRKTSSVTPCASTERARNARIDLLGVVLIPDLTGALYAPDYRALLVADLHFEKGSSRASRGVHLPPYDTRSTLRALRQAIERWNPERLISLGDSFHDDGGFDRLDADDLADVGRLAEMTDILWIAGNHDPAPAAGLPGTVAKEIALGPLVLRHLPQAGASGEIAGHLHPVASVEKRGRRLRCKCFVGNDERVVMPAFGAYTGGLSVMANPFAPLFRGPFRAWLVGRSAIHAFPSSALKY